MYSINSISFKLNRSIWYIITFIFAFSIGYLTNYDLYNQFVLKVLSPFIALLIVLAFKHNLKYLSREHYAFLLFILLGVISYFWIVKSPERFIYLSDKMVQIGIMSVIIFLVIYEYGFISSVWLASFIGIFYSIIKGYLSGNLSLDVLFIERYGGEYLNPNALGIAFYFIIILSFIVLSRTNNKYFKLLLIGVVIMSTGLLLFPASRKSVLVVSVFLITLMFIRIMKFNNILSFLFATSITFVALKKMSDLLYYFVIGQRLVKYEDPEQIGNYQIFLDGLEVMKSNPILGIGLGQFRTYIPSGRDPHSAFLLAGTELGLLGLTILVIFFYQWYKKINELKEMCGSTNMFTINILEAFYFSFVIFSVFFQFFTHVPSMVFVASILAYSTYLEKEFRIANYAMKIRNKSYEILIK